MPEDEKERPWYREPLVWMVIVIPFSAILSTIAIIYVAVISDDGLVVDDYDKQGKEINLVLARDQAAKKYELRATLIRRPDKSSLTIQFHRRHSIRLPETITLHCWHATRKGFDQVLYMKRIGKGKYLAFNKPFRPGRWYLQLSAQDWRLLSTLRVPQENTARFGYRKIP